MKRVMLIGLCAAGLLVPPAVMFAFALATTLSRFWLTRTMSKFQLTL